MHEPPERVLALHMAERARAVLLAHESVQLPRLVDVLRDVRRERTPAPCRAIASFIANFICLIDETTPCVFGTSSVSRSQPVVSLERTNHFACLAPMSRSIPLRIASAPSFAIASRGSTPFGQRSLQK